MTVSVVFAIAGVIALLFGIVGGGIKAKEVEVPLLSAKARTFTILVGVILISFTLWLELNKPASTSSLDSQILPTSSPVLTNTATTTTTPINTEVSTFVATQTSTSQDLDRLYTKLYEAKTWDLVLKDSFAENNSIGLFGM